MKPFFNNLAAIILLCLFSSQTMASDPDLWIRELKYYLLIDLAAVVFIMLLIGLMKLPSRR